MGIAKTPTIQDNNPICIRPAPNTFKPKEYLFESPHGAPYNYGSAAPLMVPAVNSVGIQKSVSIHTLQHSFAPHYTNQGVHIRYRNLRETQSPLDYMEIWK